MTRIFSCGYSDNCSSVEHYKAEAERQTALAEKYKVCGNCYHYRGDMCYYDLDRVLVDRKEKCDNWRFDEEV